MTTKISAYKKYRLNNQDFQIRFKVPTIGDQIKIGQQYAGLKAGFVGLDELSDSLSFITATLNNVIVEKPKELVFEELSTEDWSEVRKMYADYQEFAFFRSENNAGASPESK